MRIIRGESMGKRGPILNIQKNKPGQARVMIIGMNRNNFISYFVYCDSIHANKIQGKN